MGRAAMRERTSLNPMKGSTPARWQEATKLRSTAAALPPWSLPKNIQLLQPTATPRMTETRSSAAAWSSQVHLHELHEGHHVLAAGSLGVGPLWAETSWPPCWRSNSAAPLCLPDNSSFSTQALRQIIISFANGRDLIGI